MEQPNDASINSLSLTNKTPKPKPLKLLRKVGVKQLFMLLSVSLFSLVFSTSNYCPSFIKLLNFYVSTFPLRLLTHGIDKNCIFLICNGILMFLAKTSGLIKSSRTTRKKGITTKQAELLSSPDSMKPEPLVFEYPDGNLTTEIDLAQEARKENVDEANDGSSEASKDNRREEVIGAVSCEGEELHQIIDEEHESCAVSIEEDYGLNEDDDHRVNDDDDHLLGGLDDEFGAEEAEPSTEELNKKFEEFIRKMKEEIMVEDKKQLVVVD